MLKVRQRSGTGPAGPVPLRHRSRAGSWFESQTRSLFLLPAVLMLVFLSIFPLFVSLYLSLTRFQFVPGGFRLAFVGLANYRKLIVGIEREHFLGALAALSPAFWLVFSLVAIGLLVFVIRSLQMPTAAGRGVAGRMVFALVGGTVIWLLLRTLTPGGRPGSLFTTLIYVTGGIAVQYWLGLMLAYLASQELAGRRFFRVVFLLPMMITPVGIAYTFRILFDLGKGPFAPVWGALGLAEVSWVNYPWGARLAVMTGDIWQWTPFMFIVLLAALESVPTELLEAAMVDGASRWQMFWKVSWPHILPVTSTVVLIRLIEAFKIIDLPNVLTNGGPGTATESLTLHAFMAWRTLDIGGSAAVAYILLFVVTLSATSYISFIHRRVAEVV
ncbi:MAG: sugar ABC transporter permease [Armatimonadetes bacterium]|nr:sugar ABC transporter permease [Armatimonadota bacterium]